MKITRFVKKIKNKNNKLIISILYSVPIEIRPVITESLINEFEITGFIITAQQINIIEIVEKYNICPHFLNGIMFGIADKTRGKKSIK